MRLFSLFKPDARVEELTRELEKAHAEIAVLIDRCELLAKINSLNHLAIDEASARIASKIEK